MVNHVQKIQFIFILWLTWRTCPCERSPKKGQKKSFVFFFNVAACLEEHELSGVWRLNYSWTTETLVAIRKSHKCKFFCSTPQASNGLVRHLRSGDAGVRSAWYFGISVADLPLNERRVFSKVKISPLASSPRSFLSKRALKLTLGERV